MPAHVRRLLVVLLLACSGVLLAQGPAHACKCQRTSVQEDVRRADAVFSGVLLDQSTERARTGRQTTYVVDADTVFRGDVTRPRVEVTSSASTSCGLGELRTDRRYLFFVVEAGARFVTNLCSGTDRATASLVQRVEQVAGPGTDLRPDTQPEPAAPEFDRVADAEPEELTRLAAPGAALVLLGVLGLFVVRRVSARD